MRLLVVNNHSAHIKELLLQLGTSHLIDFELLSSTDLSQYDAIILSGGSSLSVKNHEKEYAAEFALIETWTKPMLGICLGFELINFAFDEELVRLNARESGTLPIELLDAASGDALFGTFPRAFTVYESHRWIVAQNKFLLPLARSKDGIEAVKHPQRMIYGVQFHPEVFVADGHAAALLRSFLDYCMKMKPQTKL